MIKDIGITFKMKISQNGDTEEINFDANAKLLKKRDTYYLKFKEPVIDGPGYNDTLFIMTQDSITIERQGQVKMSQDYKINQHCIGTYKNNYIETPITTYTNAYLFNKRRLYLNYNMIINKENVGQYEMEVNFKGDDQI
ncbi:DUF1934 domain-containing protein [Haloplasma contractile]|uniref:DUF1934 domain-containing protein n=1 Tax=Haloplasma contractile SSD-17B TaxID=1033810 RepID=F7PWR8_9MOLU|nr:DUF1934 domain-containing protein [Haloplasma contractile]ERJ12557.1 hypothetical protein HLPCO_001543 [Haloplasma contractile SSD-17B]